MVKLPTGIQGFLVNALLADTIRPVTRESETPLEALNRLLVDLTESEKRSMSILSMAETQRAAAGKDLYMIGLANGLILAHATLKGTSPQYVETEQLPEEKH